MKSLTYIQLRGLIPINLFLKDDISKNLLIKNPAKATIRMRKIFDRKNPRGMQFNEKIKNNPK